MKPIFWVVLCSTLPPLVFLCGPECCNIHESSSSLNVSPLLKSLRCHNNFESHVHCKWREHGNTTLQLWFKTENNRKQCVPYGAVVQDESEHRTVQCRYKTPALTIGIKHTAFFLENKTLSLCSSVPNHTLDLSLHLRARPPGNLTSRGAEDGGRRLSWSSPYPSSSSLNRHITYQLSYRTDTQDTWTTANVTNTSVKLEKLQDGRYEAKVRARANVGQWSDWSPVVTWHTEEDAGQHPSLHCVLNGEKEVACSWEVSRDVVHFITYQLACRSSWTAQSERCCVNPTITSDLSKAVLTFSCTLTVADPAHLLVELLPARNAKSFEADQHIRPNPPQQVKVRQKGSIWMVEWTDPSTASKIGLCYQVCYYRTQDQGSSVLVNISKGSMHLNIPGASLAPSQHYQVKVRSLVVPVQYKGIPSEWTEPEAFISHGATWSVTTLIYSTISVLVVVVFLTLYCTIPACQRRVVLWVDSVPSPGKSKILSEIKSATSRTLMQSESTSICKVLRLDSVSTCSSDALLWSSKDSEKKHLEQDEGCWKCDNLPSPAEKVNGSDTSSMSFSGPYIFCQSSERSKCEEKDRKPETPSDKSASPSSVNFTTLGDGYVCLPGRGVSRSTQDLVSHSDANTNKHRPDGTEQDQQCSDKMEEQPGLSEATGEQQPPPYTSGPFTSWPQGGTTQPSGYCHLPAAFIRQAK